MSKTATYPAPPSGSTSELPLVASAIADLTHNGGPGFEIFDPSGHTSCRTDVALCHFCQSMVDTVLLPRTTTSITPRSNISHHTTLEEFTASGSECHLCNLIARELSTIPANDLDIDRDTTIQINPDDKSCAFSVKQGSTVTLPFRLRLNSTTANAHENYQLGKLLVAEDGLVRVPDNYPSTEENLELIRSWIDACTGHLTCQHTRLDSPLPKRVLDISRTDDLVTLYESNVKGEKAPYVTLSYCWGDGLPLRTLTNNISQHKKGIPLEAFPATMRDIIPLARYLGFRYLWIDALCIIQDNPADWQEQATTMTAIYQGCSLNIAVSDAQSCDAGATRTLHRSSVLLGTKSSSVSTQNSDAEIVVVCEPQLNRNSPSEGPLSTRGWVFQETLVSIATIYICHYGLYWDCCSRSCRQGTSEDLRNPIGGGGMARFETAKASWASNLSRLSQTTSRAARAWGGGHRPDVRQRTSPLWALYPWVSAVSGRRLTVPKDKLPVFSGLVSRIVAASGATYVAGLWKEDIILGLTWHVERASPSSERHNYRAPSWSWASVDGRVEWLWCISVNAKYPAHVLLGTNDLEVLDIVVDEVFPGSFGEVRGGRITAIGTLYDETQLSGQLYCFRDEKRKVVEGFQPKRYFLQIAYVQAVRATIGKAKGAFWQTFLMIEKTDSTKKNEFRRVGYAHDQDRRSAQYNGGRRKRITLV